MKLSRFDLVIGPFAGQVQMVAGKIARDNSRPYGSELRAFVGKIDRDLVDRVIGLSTEHAVLHIVDRPHIPKTELPLLEAIKENLRTNPKFEWHEYNV